MVWSPKSRRALSDLLVLPGNELECRLRINDLMLARLVWDRMRVYMIDTLKRSETPETTMMWVHPTNGYRCLEGLDGKRREMKKQSLGDVKWSFWNDTGVTCKVAMSKEDTAWDGSASSGFWNECVGRLRHRVSFPLAKGGQLDLTKVTDESGQTRYEIECEIQKPAAFWDVVHEWFGYLLDLGLFVSRNCFIEQSMFLYSRAVQQAWRPRIHLASPSQAVSTSLTVSSASSSLSTPVQPQLDHSGRRGGRIVQLPSVDPSDYVLMSTYKDATHFFLDQVGTGYVYAIPLLPAHMELKSVLIRHKLVLVCYPLPPHKDRYLVVDVLVYKDKRITVRNDGDEEETDALGEDDKHTQQPSHADKSVSSDDAFTDRSYEEWKDVLQPLTQVLEWTSDAPSFTYGNANQLDCMSRMLQTAVGAASLGLSAWQHWTWVDCTVAEDDELNGVQRRHWTIHLHDWKTPTIRTRVIAKWPRSFKEVTVQLLENPVVEELLTTTGLAAKTWTDACLPRLDALIRTWLATKRPPTDDEIERLASTDEAVCLSAIKTIALELVPSKRDQVVDAFKESFGGTNGNALSPLAKDIYTGWALKQWQCMLSFDLRSLYLLLHASPPPSASASISFSSSFSSSLSSLTVSGGSAQQP
jgi:hypothetical protein